MNEKEWKKISKAFFAKPEVKTSEDFVANVMSRIEKKSNPSAAWLWPRWMTPVATMAGLSILFFTGDISKEFQPTTEQLLEACADGSYPTESGACDEDPEVEELIALDLEVL